MTDALPELSVPPAEAIRFFERKGFDLASIRWEDTWQEEHGRAFVVAGVTKRALLQDIHNSLAVALRDGRTYQQWKAEFDQVLDRHGWAQPVTIADPKTGLKTVDLTRAWRGAVIFDTNMRTAASAGRWERIQRNKATLPYLMYDAVNDGRTRPLHRSWDNTVLPVDHPWWATHFPPNGWRCRCSTYQLSERDLKRRGLSVSPDPQPVTREWINPATGVVEQVPAGIDPGFAYNPGQSHLAGVTPRETTLAGRPRLVDRTSDSVPLPPLTVAPDRRPLPLLPDGLSPEDYAAPFLDRFGAAIGRPVVFTDRAGEALPVSDELFRDNSRRWKLRRDRGRYTVALAEAIIDPDEIWTQWEEVASGWRLKRNFVAKLIVEGSEQPVLAIFSYMNGSWKQVTSFNDREQVAEGLRSGFLEYRRVR